jgi:Sulfotransferase domain
MTEAVIVVSGLPRSGTSMAMRLLEAGGLDVVADNLRQADEDNPNGYYEYERVKNLKTDHTWLSHAHGKVVKMVSMLLYELPADKNYKIVFMRRDLDEVCASQGVMLKRRGEKPRAGDETMGKLYSTHLREIESWLTTQQNIEILFVNYNDIMENPEKGVEEMNKFFGNRLSTDRMISVVDKSLYRNRKMHAPEKSQDAPIQHEDMNDDKDNEAIEAQLKALGYM